MLTKNVVLASYFNANKDPQRNIYWDNDYSLLLPLINSVTQHGIEIIIFHDCFTDLPNIDKCRWEKVEQINSYVPSIVRWFHYLSYLSNTNFDRVFMVDSTDVVMLKNPFDSIKPTQLYIGTEYNNTWRHPYLKNKDRYIHLPDYKDIKNKSIDEILLNCGVCGGYADIVIDFLTMNTIYHSNTSHNIINVSLDMPVFNYTLRKHFNDILYIGDKVNTKFKEYEVDNTIAWWKHK